MLKRERFNLEFKEEISKSFLKTVSAFSNYNDGKILFGINDDGKITGINDINNDCLKIENMINDSFNPLPKYKIQIEEENDLKYIVLNVSKGRETPYYYKGKTYRRSDTATVEVDRLELNRLILEGINLNFEEMEAKKQDLEFSVLESKLKKVSGIEHLHLDILKTLSLYNKDGYYTIAGEIFADDNSFTYSGIDLVRFGKNINHILDRETFANESILLQYDGAINMFKKYYQYEEIIGFVRETKDLIPQEAFREALANALIHRVWDIHSHIQISMYNDKVEITSPGGLPSGLSKDDYLHKNISVLRNPIIAAVFYRLKYIEQFGTGITRIINEYKDSLTKPSFDVSENNLKITLPVLESDLSNLSKDEGKIFTILKNKPTLTRDEIDKNAEFNKAKTLRTINLLLEKNLIKKIGQGPGTKYAVNE